MCAQKLTMEVITRLETKNNLKSNYTDKKKKTIEHETGTRNSPESAKPIKWIRYQRSKVDE